MAINGNLKDMSFVELLRLVGRRTGRLCIFDFNGKRQYEWYLDQNNVYAVKINQTPLTDVEAVYQTALALAHDCTSSYIFYKQDTIDKFPFETVIPLDQLMAKSLSIISASTSHAYAQHFPHHDTKFEAVTNPSAALYNETLDFWRQTADLLRQGASASDIADQTMMKVESVCAELYKLKLLGIIYPIRVFAQTVGSQPIPPQAVAPAAPPPPQFSRSGGENSENNVAKALPSHVLPNAETDLKRNERKSLVSRMLGSLFGKQKLIGQ